MAVNVGRGVTLVVGGLVVFLVFTMFAPVLITNWYGVSGDYNLTPGGNFTSAGQVVWNLIPDLIAYGGALLGIGIFILGVLDLVGFKIIPGKRK